MAYPSYIREKARKLRKQRLTLDEIAMRLAVPKTTVWYWIRDIEIVPPGHALQTPARRAARLGAARKNSERAAQKRLDAYNRGLDEFEALEMEPGFRDFVCMYLGEGDKRNRNRVAICNSDPQIVRLADHWMRRLTNKQLRYSLQYHADQDPDYLLRFWSLWLGFDPRYFRLQRKSNSGGLNGRNWRSKWGVLSITAYDTQLRARVGAWMARVQESWIDSLADGV